MMSRLTKVLKNHWVLLVLVALQLFSFFCAEWESTGLLYLKREMQPYSLKTLGDWYLLLAAAYLLWTAYAPCENWPYAPFWVWAFCGFACWLRG